MDDAAAIDARPRKTKPTEAEPAAAAAEWLRHPATPTKTRLQQFITELEEGPEWTPPETE